MAYYMCTGAVAGTAGAGKKAILLDRGARLDIFAAAMLGNIEVVTAIIAAYPAAVDARGPHGIPLLEHARAGGAQAAAVTEYLESLSAPEGTAAR